MKNVIEALQYMAERGGAWSVDLYAGNWLVDMFDAKSYTPVDVGFTQDELKEFLKHYKEIANEQSN